MTNLYKIHILIFCILCPLFLQAQDYTKEDVDKQIEDFVNKGWYTNASNLMVEYANYVLDNKDSLSALEYQIENCKLVDAHLDYFKECGLTSEMYLANYTMVMFLQRQLGQIDNSIRTYLKMYLIAERENPSKLALYTEFISSALGDCTSKEFADSVYCLQKSLDRIKKDTINSRNVHDYVWFCECFYMNRIYNSFDGHFIKKLPLKEIETWHERNSDYIEKLDTTLYKNDIVDYELFLAEEICLLANSIGAQWEKYIEAVSIYLSVIDRLKPFVSLSDKISIKIASCYANMAQNYYEIGDYARCKEYSDMGYKYLNSHIEDFDYCDILNILSLNAYHTNMRKLAANLKLEELSIREKLNWEPSLSDWLIYFMYVIDDNPQMVLNLKDIVKNSRHDIVDVPTFYGYIGNAYSMLMTENRNYNDSAFYYYKKAYNSIKTNFNQLKDEQYINIIGSLYNSMTDHYLRLGILDSAYVYAQRAYQIFYNKTGSYRYADMAYLSCMLHDTKGIRSFLPNYYYELESELCKILPVLGSVESSLFLKNGSVRFYAVPEWCYYNPTDTTCLGIAYDNVLFQKGLTLRYESSSVLVNEGSGLLAYKKNLDLARDSIYRIQDEQRRFLALTEYEQKERKFLQAVDEKQLKVHWRDIQRTLLNNECCVEFIKFTKNQYTWMPSVVTKSHYMALVLDKTHEYPTLVDLFDEDELNDLYYFQPKSYGNEVGSDIYNKVWGKLSPFIGNKKEVFFSPMGLLNLINIEMLTDSTGVTACEKYNLHRVSSTKQLLSLRQNEQIHSIVTFGGIDYKKADEHSTLMDSLNTRGNWSFLSGSVKEVQSIEKTLSKDSISVRTVTGKNATEKSFKALDGTDVSVIHIASHGFYITPAKRANIPYYTRSNDTQSIQDEMFYSGLIMSGGQKAWENGTFSLSADDGILSSYEISKMDLHNVKLVVLSACESGLGDNLYDGIYGLQRAFKKAGVQSLLMSLWKIDDASTADFMSLFYKNIAVGQSLQDSYRLTISEMRTKYKDPYFWASFVLLD